jgi:hypothetical protein
MMITCTFYPAMWMGRDFCERVLMRNLCAILFQACTFHPEITGDARIHEYFLQMASMHGKPYSLPK